jgi:tetratricopeptide (TPR) repeat protein
MPEEALARLEQIGSDENPELIDPDEILEIRLQAYRALGRVSDAIRLIEQELIPLDELDPPYSLEVTRQYALYAELLQGGSQSKKSQQILLELLENGDPQGLDTAVWLILSGIEEGKIAARDWKNLADILGELPVTIPWHRFADALWKSDDKDLVRAFYLKGFEEHSGVLRSIWPAYLESATDTALLQVALEVLESTRTNLDPKVDLDWQAIRLLTLRRVGRTAEALELIKAKFWSDFDLRRVAAEILAASGDISSASTIYADMEKEYPGRFIEAWGDLLLKKGADSEALALWATLPERMGITNPRSYMSWAKILKDRGFLKESRDVILAGMNSSSQPNLFPRELLEISLSMNDVESALTAYKGLRDQSPREAQLWNPNSLIDRLKMSQQVSPFGTRLQTVLEASETVTAPWMDLAVELGTELFLRLNRTDVLEGWLHHPPATVQKYWTKTDQQKSSHLLWIALDLYSQSENRLAEQFFRQIPDEYLSSQPGALESAAQVAGEVGDASTAIHYWNTLLGTDRITLEQRSKACLAMTRLALDRYQPGQALEWLNRLSTDQRRVSDTVETSFLKALAYTQLHQKSKAMELLEEIHSAEMNRSAEAAFWLGQWALWSREWDQAKDLFKEVLASDPGQELANETLWQLRFQNEIPEEQLPDLAVASFFEVGGQWDESEQTYRKLASALGDSPVVSWLYFRVGHILLKAGKTDQALQQWKVVKEKYDNPLLARRIDYEIASLPGSATGPGYIDIVLTSPNTLLGDLARKQTETPVIVNVESMEPAP